MAKKLFMVKASLAIDGVFENRKPESTISVPEKFKILEAQNCRQMASRTQ